LRTETGSVCRCGGCCGRWSEGCIRGRSSPYGQGDGGLRTDEVGGEKPEARSQKCGTGELSRT
jgi:hypothetical protein